MDDRRRRALFGALLALALLLLLAGAARFLLAETETAPRAGDAAAGPGAEARDGPALDDGAAPPAPPTVDPPGTAGPDPPEPDPRGPSGSPDAAPSSAPPAAARDPASGVLAGRVVDDLTGRPVAGARVLLGITAADGTEIGWYGDRTGPDGAFSFDVLRLMSEQARREVKEEEIRDRKFDLRVRAPGCEPARLRGPAAETEVRLVRDPTPPVPGSVRGVATTRDGSAFHGRLKFESYENEWGWYACPWAHADERGNFLLEGVPAGNWRMRVSAEGALQTVAVPEGGEAFVALQVPGGGVDERQDALPAETREVVASGFTADALHRSWMRADRRPGHFFRVETAGGRARFPDLPLGRWKFVLERPGREDVAVDAEVVAGEGPQGVTFPGD